MAWYEAHQTLARHPKTLKLARMLNADRRYAVGLLHDLFSWALDAADKNGSLRGLEPADIGRALDFPPKKGLAVVSALLEAGYLEAGPDGYAVHDWFDYAGKLSQRREEEKAYKARKHALYNDMRLVKAVRARDGGLCRYCGKPVNWNDRKGPDGGTYDHVDPAGENDLENIVVACRACDSRKGSRTPGQAGMTLLPPPGRFRADFG